MQRKGIFAFFVVRLCGVLVKDAAAGEFHGQ